MRLTTAIPPLAPWRIAPSIDTLRSRYDASAEHWDDYLARLGQHQDYQRLFKSRAVRDGLSQLDQTSKILDCGVGTGAFSLALLDSIAHPVQVSGVDISSPMLTHAQQNLKHRSPEQTQIKTNRHPLHPFALILLRTGQALHPFHAVSVPLRGKGLKA
jgi:ubiquinone/menaquinone biosynthesis C-methylase UbiE